MLKMFLAGVMAMGFYPQTFVVSHIDYDNNIVSMTDFNNEEYQFSGTEDWSEGDIVSAIMADNATPDDISDDFIVSKKYSGYYF